MAFYDENGGGGTFQPAQADPASGETRIRDGYVFRWARDDFGKFDWIPVGRADSSGGSSGPDHYGEVSGNTAATLASNEKRDALTQAFNEAEAKRDQANQDRDWALSMGDRETAKAKQADANHWAGVAAQHDANLEALTARGQDITAQGNAQQYAVGMANVAQAKYDSDNRFQVGMAGAVNDQQRNEIADRWNKEQAQIAKMEDETKRVLGGQQNQTAQFGAETDRAARMGTLALDNNKFIQEMATSPRDLFSLYFMQRGLAPDWNAVTNGSPVAQGAALAPADVMNAYTPTTAPVQFGGTPGNVAAGSVGNAVNSGGVGSNQFIGPSTATAPAAAAGGGGGGSAPPPFQPTQIAAYGGAQIPHSEPVNRAITPTIQIPAVAADSASPRGQSDGLGHYWNSDTQAWHNENDGSPYVPMLAYGGFTQARQFVTGDAPMRDPRAGGARPEMIENPTGAPIRVHNSADTARMMGYMPRFALGTDASAAYGANGMGNAWIPESQTQYDTSTMPAALRGLAGYGVPITPSLYSAATGQVAPTLNMGLSANGRGIGVLPSLQGMNRMTPGEQKNYRGYAEGVGGIPWDDLTDFISRGTANLQKAAVSRAA